MRWKFLVLILLWFGVSCCVYATPESPPRISIIIDDLGNNQYWDYKVAELPGPIVCSILPYTFYSIYVDHLCHDVDKEIILHTPMQALKPHSLGPGGLTVNLSQAQFNTTLNNDINQIPYLSGINNHMGSLLTEKPEQMTWVMQVIKPKGLFYLDSRTSGGSIAENIAREDGVPTASRDIFLDDIRTTAAVRQQFELLLAAARIHGSAIAIGHPYPATITFLQQEIPQLQAQGYELVPVSDLLQYGNGHPMRQIQKPETTKVVINPPLPEPTISQPAKVIPIVQSMPMPVKVVQAAVVSKPKITPAVKITTVKPVEFSVMKTMRLQAKELQAYFAQQKQIFLQDMNQQDEEMQLRVTIWKDKIEMLLDNIFVRTAALVQQTQNDLQAFDQESAKAYSNTSNLIKSSIVALEPKANPVTVISQKLQRAQTKTAIQVAKSLPIINAHEWLAELKTKTKTQIKQPVKNANIIVVPYVPPKQVIIVEPLPEVSPVAVAKTKHQTRQAFPAEFSHITPLESFALDLLQYELCPQSVHVCREWY